MLTDGIELTSVVPLRETHDAAEILALAGGVAAAAGSPWGNAFSRAGNLSASEGSFDGAQASALVDGGRYTLEPVADGGLGEGVDRADEAGAGE